MALARDKQSAFRFADHVLSFSVKFISVTISDNGSGRIRYKADV
jgi:hypothetical protein